MSNLATFGFADMMHLRGRLRSLFEAGEPPTFEAAAQRVVQEQIGVNVSSVLSAEAIPLDARDVGHNVFHVPGAPGSPYVPAQHDFVEPYGIRSVLGFGGLLASGDLVAGLLFSRVPVSAEAADQFKVIGLNFKLAMLPFMRKPSFEAASSSCNASARLPETSYQSTDRPINQSTDRPVS